MALDARLQRLLEAAGEEALARFGRATVSSKADRSIVTDADRAAEAVLKRGLQAEFPDDGLIGEEGTRVEGTGATWHIDPIDGTNAFVEGLAHWGPTIARTRDGRVEVGATWFPRVSDFFYAEAGGGAFLNGRRLPALPDQEPGRRTPVFLPSSFHRWARLEHAGLARNLGSNTAHLCLVAAGAAHACFIAAGWSPWDVLAGLCLLGEVEGVATTLQGQTLDPLADVGVPFVAGSPLAALRLREAISFPPLGVPPHG